MCLRMSHAYATRDVCSRFTEMTRKCIFCGGTKLSNEHVVAQWIGELLDHRNVNSTHIPDTFSPQSRGTHRTASGGMQTGRVCASCNNGWMSAMESNARPWLSQMVMGRGAQLDEDGQQAVANWCVKTSLCSLLTSPKAWQPNESLFREFYSRLTPLSGHSLAIGACASQKRATVFHYQPLAIANVSGDSVTDAINGHAITLMIGQFVSHLLYFPASHAVTIESRILRNIWPASGTFIWPTGIFNDCGVEELAKTILPVLDHDNPHAPLASTPWDDLKKRDQ